MDKRKDLEGKEGEPVASLPGAARHKCEGCGAPADMITPYCLICQVEGEINSFMTETEVGAARKRVRAALEAALAAPEPASGEGSPSHPSGPSQDSQEVREAANKVIAEWRRLFTSVDFTMKLCRLHTALAELEIELEKAALSQSPKGAAGRECEVVWRNGEPFCLVANCGRMEGLVGSEVVRMVEAAGGESGPSAPKTGLRGADAPGEGATCAWSYADPETGEWVTDCGTSWCFTDGDPIENEVKFCVGCGKPVEVIPDKPEEDEEDGAPGDVGSAGGAA